MPARRSAVHLPAGPRPVEEPGPSSRTGMHQIGEVAERVGLSLRTVRYYEEMGLLAPSARTRGGFRLYTEQDVERLVLIKQMKPLGFTLEEMRDLLEVRDRLGGGRPDRVEHLALLARLADYAAAASEKHASLKAQLAVAEGFADTLRREVHRHRRLAGQDAR